MSLVVTGVPICVVVDENKHGQSSYIEGHNCYIYIYMCVYIDMCGMSYLAVSLFSSSCAGELGFVRPSAVREPPQPMCACVCVGRMDPPFSIEYIYIYIYIYI